MPTEDRDKNGRWVASHVCAHAWRAAMPDATQLGTRGHLVCSRCSARLYAERTSAPWRLVQLPRSDPWGVRSDTPVPDLGGEAGACVSEWEDPSTPTGGHRILYTVRHLRCPPMWYNEGVGLAPMHPIDGNPPPGEAPAVPTVWNSEGARLAPVHPISTATLYSVWHLRCPPMWYGGGAGLAPTHPVKRPRWPGCQLCPPRTATRMGAGLRRTFARMRGVRPCRTLLS